jgi:hypothetical protein
MAAQHAIDEADIRQALVVPSLPVSWVGGKLFALQLQREPKNSAREAV